MIEFTYRCDGPFNRYTDEPGGCPTNAKVPRYWVLVTWEDKQLEFCCWDCAIAWGSENTTPIEVVGWNRNETDE